MNQNWLLVALLLVLFGLPGHSQTTTEMDMMALQDQPGYVPDPSEEQLDVVYQRQPVFFRTTEKPGTIVVSTSERFLYLVQGNNRAIKKMILIR